MRIRAGRWSPFWRETRAEEVEERSEEDAELREIFVRTGLRAAAAFVLLFGIVFFAFWWSGKAVAFGAARATDRAVPTWRVLGTVRNAITHEPVPWAVVEDDAGGRPPFYRTEASYSGVYELLTLAEPHRIRVSAPGYRSAIAGIGRTWFLWLPKGEEKRDIELQPE
jgi:hypothetical protein